MDSLTQKILDEAIATGKLEETVKAYRIHYEHSKAYYETIVSSNEENTRKIYAYQDFCQKQIDDLTNFYKCASCVIALVLFLAGLAIGLIL